jgi:hypothetical protein
VTFSRNFAEALSDHTDHVPFSLVAPRDLVQSSPEFLPLLNALELFRNNKQDFQHPGDLASELENLIEEIEDQIGFVAEMVKTGLITMAPLFRENHAEPSAARREVLEVTCQQYTQDSMRLATLITLRDIFTAPARSPNDGPESETEHPV